MQITLLSGNWVLMNLRSDQFSTTRSAESAWIAGFVAGDGTFTSSGRPRTFTFAVTLGYSDFATCQRMRDFFQVGTVHVYRKRKDHYQDEVRYQVRAMRDLINVIVPFMDEHLPPSYKRNQYLEWKGPLPPSSLRRRPRLNRHTPLCIKALLRWRVLAQPQRGGTDDRKALEA